MSDPIFISAEFIEKNTNFSELIEALQTGFSSNDILVPPRHHHDLPNSNRGLDTTMLIMPAWQDSLDGGVKVVTVNPENKAFGLPSIQGSYLYMDAQTGQLKAIIEAKKLTAKRTAAASALASSYLSKTDSTSMLMIGTGALSTELIKAHATVRPIQQVYVWGRDLAKATSICTTLKDEHFSTQTVETITSAMAKVDLISSATLSQQPLIKGIDLKAGQHLDLVGSYKPDMREADDTTLSKATLYADVKEMAIKESGDFSIPLANGVINKQSIRADLFDLCGSQIKGRSNNEELTLFKSVGHALEDLIAARYYYQKFINS